MVHAVLIVERDLDDEDLHGLVQRIDDDLVWTADQPREDFLITVYRGSEIGVISDREDDEEDDDEARGRCERFQRYDSGLCPGRGRRAGRRPGWLRLLSWPHAAGAARDRRRPTTAPAVAPTARRGCCRANRGARRRCCRRLPRRAPTSAPTGAATTASAPLVQAALGNLSKTLHPYPDSAAYTQPWIDAAALIWGGADGGGGLLAFDWDTLDYRPAMATDLPNVSSDGKTFTFNCVTI